MRTNNPLCRVWFVDLTEDPAIKRRVLPSSARQVASLGIAHRSRPNTTRAIPDDTGRRFWVYAKDEGEALYEAKRLAG